MTEIHSCSYFCERPECIKQQRDELRERLACILNCASMVSRYVGAGDAATMRSRAIHDEMAKHGVQGE